jgi:hypothetical protein
MMRALGYVLIVVGFLGGALTTVLDEETVRWTEFAAAALVATIGIALVRISIRREARAEGKLATNMQVVRDSLDRVAEGFGQLRAELPTMDPYDVRYFIDANFAEQLGRFVAARESIAHVHGLQAYAEVMNDFAAGERYLNRVWSASADGYVDEVEAYVGKAAEQFDGAIAKVRALGAG